MPRYVMAMLGVCMLIGACSRQPADVPSTDTASAERRFLALGDSYTIGQGVSAADRWPTQLATELRVNGWLVAEPVIIAQAGWTTGELAAAILGEAPSGPFDLVSLLIGVNDQYRGRDLGEYRQEFRTLLQGAIAFAGGDAGRVIVLSIPDWGVTPFAAGRDREKIAQEIDRFNLVNRQEAEGAGVRYVDVTALSRQAASDPDLIAADGLHPSAKMYQAWVQLVLPEVIAALEGSAP